MHRLVQPDPHHLRDPAGIIAVALVDLLRLQHRLHVACLNADHRQPGFRQPGHQPLRQRSSFQPDTSVFKANAVQESNNGLRLGCYLGSGTTFPPSSTMQIAVSLTDTSRPTECFMAVLPLSTSEAGSPRPRSHRQCEELPLPPPANFAETAIPHLKNAQRVLVFGAGASCGLSHRSGRNSFAVKFRLAILVALSRSRIGTDFLSAVTADSGLSANSRRMFSVIVIMVRQAKLARSSR